MKGQMGLSNMWEAILAFVVIAIVGTVGALILSGFDDQTNDTIAQNFIDESGTGLNTIADFLPLIAITIVGVIVLVLVLTAVKRIRNEQSGE